MLGFKLLCTDTELNTACFLQEHLSGWRYQHCNIVDGEGGKDEQLGGF